MNISRLNEMLNKKLGPKWSDLEIETISLEIGAQFDDVTVVKFAVLKAVHEYPDVVLKDADYFLRFIEVANMNLPDPHHHDIPTSIELDFALKELESILGDKMVKTSMLKQVAKYVVNNEGHGKAASDRIAKYIGVDKVTTEFTKVYEEYAKDMAKQWH